MPVFEYSGFDKSGKAGKGVITADTPEEARQILRHQEYHVKDIKSVKKRQPFFISGTAASELTIISRQLSTLLKSGTNLAESISIIIRQVENPGLRSAFMEILESIKRGISFGNAIEEYPRYFSPLYINMVKAGESSGMLDLVLGRIAEYLRNRKKITGGIVTAMAYPLVVMVIGIIVVTVLMTTIVPRLIEIIMKSSGKGVLPLPTKVLVFASDIVRNYWWLLLTVIIVCVYLFVRMFKSEKGRYVFDKFLLKVPVIGNLFEKTAISRFAITFSTLLQSGITPLDSLLIVQDVLNNKYLEEAIVRVRKGVVDGNDMSAELEKTGVFPPIVGHMVSVGEETGELEFLLQQIAEAYDIEVELATEKLISVLEPIMIVIMAVVIGFIVFAVILPIVEIGNIR